MSDKKKKKPFITKLSIAIGAIIAIASLLGVILPVLIALKVF